MGDLPGVRAASATTIEIRFYYRRIRCKERLKLAPTRTNLKYAARLRARVLSEIEDGTFDYAAHFPHSPRAAFFHPVPSAQVTVRDCLSHWLERQKPVTKASTWNNWRKIVNNQLIPQFGDLLGSELSRRHIKDWLAGREVSSATVKNLLVPLRNALNDAVEDERLTLSPMAGWKVRTRRGVNPRKEAIRPFTDDERTRIIAAATGPTRNLVQFAFWTGLRVSELIALRWIDVDLPKRQVHVRRALTQYAEEPEEPKTRAGERTVKLLTPALTALEDQVQYTGTGPLVFTRANGECWDGDRDLREELWQPLLETARVEYRYPYQMRHTYASMMLMAGESPRWVAVQMGHKDWAFTARTYYRYMPADDPDAGNRAEALWATKRPDPAPSS